MGAFFTLGLTLLGYNNSNIIKDQSHSNEEISRATNDSIGLLMLTRKLYKWHETESSQVDFAPGEANKKDSIYSGIDWNAHSKRLKELEKTNFFSREFLDNYNALARKIDKDLKNGSSQWLIGDLPPFGNDANPWCNCQDNPDNYWNSITLTNIHFDNNKVTYNWTWGDNFRYKAKARKENGTWKISYLQGFDYKEFFPK